MNIKTLFNRTALLLLLSISYSNFSAVAIGQTKSKLPSSSPKKTTQSYPDFRSDDYEHLRLIHFFQTISPNQTKTAEHLGLTAKEISEIHLGTQTQVASQAMKVLQNLEQKEKKLRVLRNSLQNDPPNRNVTHEIEHLEKEIRKSHIKLLLKAVDFIENRLSSIQFKRLDRLSYYRATLESFKHHGFLKVPIEENDRYLMWPAWIAESLELDDELIEKLLETGIQEEKRLLKKLDSEKNKQIFSTKKSKLSDIQKNALKRLVEQIESQQEGLKNIAITGLLFQLESSSQFELTPSQTSEIEQLKKDLMAKLNKAKNSDSKKRKLSHKYQLETLKILKPFQKKHLVESSRKHVLNGWNQGFRRYYKPLVVKILDGSDQKTLEETLLDIENQRRTTVSFSNADIKKSVARILKDVPKNHAEEIRKLMGDRNCRSVIFPVKKKRFLANTWDPDPDNQTILPSQAQSQFLQKQ